MTPTRNHGQSPGRCPGSPGWSSATATDISNLLWQTVKPDSVQNGQGNLPGFRIRPGAKKNSSGLTKTYKVSHTPNSVFVFVVDMNMS
jgi:hypothetical protein